MAHPGNTEDFFSIYAEELATAMKERPGDYMPGRTAEEIADKFKNIILNGGDIGRISIDSLAWRRTCKRVGIKHSYKAIREYLR